MKNEKAGVASMDHELTVTIAQMFAGLLLIGMAFYMMRRARSNRRSMLEKNAPKIAGEDEMGGGARNPQQFEEPDDDALEMMAELLEESQDSADEP